jgi:GTP pyrophosphokinase
MVRINEIIDAVKDYHPSADVTQIMKAYVYSAKVHAGQLRSSGEPYLSHPLAVASLLTGMHLDVASICAGLLHDAVEDTQATLADIEKLLGKETATLVDGVTKITELTSATSAARQAESLRKMILAMAGDIRVLIIKLGDRLHNMRTLGYLPEAKQRRIAADTRDIYAPMAHRLGIRRWQAELEDLALYYLDQAAYRRIAEGVALRQADREAFQRQVMAKIGEGLEEAGIQGRVEGRSKHLASIYQKMQRRHVDIDELYDIVAFRIIVGDLRDCYEALGMVHNVWKPIPGRFRDYIGMPKPNGYQSLHTAVVGPMGQRMEVQIRTEDMHRVAEVGIAAHWRYKEEGGGDASEENRFAWLRRLLDWQREMDDPSEFLQSLRMDLYPEEIFVFTPHGDVKELPRGATPVDFAYAIHTEVGHRCVGAKVNGRMVPLRTELSTGDQVEIITQTNHTPSKDWLKFVVSSRARSKIRAYIRESERSRAVSLGRDLLDRELRKRNSTLHAVLKDNKLEPVLADFSLKDPDHLLAAVAYGKISPRHVVNRVLPREAEEKSEEKRPGFFERALGRRRRRPQEGVRVKGVEDVMVRFAKCCNPLPGDPISGYITRGRGVTVHESRCPHLDRVDPARRVDLEWDVPEGQLRPARIQVVNSDRSGALADMAAVLKKRDINILEADVKTTEEQQGIATFTIEVKDAGQLTQVLRDLKKIKGVSSVKKLGLE